MGTAISRLVCPGQYPDTDANINQHTNGHNYRYNDCNNHANDHTDWFDYAPFYGDADAQSYTVSRPGLYADA